MKKTNDIGSRIAGTWRHFAKQRPQMLSRNTAQWKMLSAILTAIYFSVKAFLKHEKIRELCLLNHEVFSQKKNLKNIYEAATEQKVNLIICIFYGGSTTITTISLHLYKRKVFQKFLYRPLMAIFRNAGLETICDKIGDEALLTCLWRHRNIFWVKHRISNK